MTPTRAFQAGFQGDVVFATVVGINLDAIGGDSPIFDFGIAWRSPVELKGNAKLKGLNSPLEARILSAINKMQAFDLTGNVNLDGDFYTTIPAALVSMCGNVKIARVICRGPTCSAVRSGLGNRRLVRLECFRSSAGETCRENIKYADAGAGCDGNARRGRLLQV